MVSLFRIATEGICCHSIARFVCRGSGTAVQHDGNQGGAQQVALLAVHLNLYVGPAGSKNRMAGLITGVPPHMRLGRVTPQHGITTRIINI